MPITRFKDEKEREEYLKKIREEQQSNLNKYFKQTGLENAYSGNYTNSHDGFNTAGMNDFAVKPSVWEQVKTTASNMLGNVGYGIGNGLIGFTQNEMRNQTSFKTLKSLGDTMLNNTLLGLPKGLGNLGKSIDATLKKNENYQNAKNILNTTIENNKNAIINPINEKLQKQEDINNERIRQNTIETTNPIGRKLVELAPSIGQMLPSAIPGAGTLYSVGSATDSYYDEAKARGMNEEQASTYSQLMGVVEGLTEQIGVGRFVKGGKVAKSSMSKAFRELGIGMTDNFIQEGIIEPISELTTKVTAGDEFLKHDYRTIEGWKELGSDMLNSAIDGALVGGIVGSASLGIGKASNLVDKMKKGYIPTSSDVRETFNEARKNGVDVDGIIQEELKSRISQPTENTRQNKNQVVTSQQDIANKINEIVKNDKYLSPEDKQSMIYATNDLASKNQLDNNNTLDAINQIKQMSQLSQENSDKLDIGKKYLSGRKEIYNKYRNITNYDNVIVEQAKEVIAPNKQGKRTKDQWLDVAKYIGTNIANRPNSEIQRIAYKSWQEETPNNTGTLNRQGQKYVKFMPDDWIDTIYDSVEKQRQKSGYVAKNDTINVLDNLYKEYMNNQTAQNNIDTSSMNLIDSAKAYNLNGNDETIQSINQKLHDRGITSRFDENLFKDSNGKVRTDVNALWRNTIDEKGNTQREVIFNPRADTNKTLQQVSIHEMLHDMTGTKEFDDLSKLILDKNSTREGYSDARSNLEEMYSQVYDKNSKDLKKLVDEEEVADTLAQKLGDQEFINSLNKEKPNVFKRIYDWVVDKLNKFTGSKNEKIYWEDVKNKFENAYRQDYQIENKTNAKYSVGGKEGLKNITDSSRRKEGLKSYNLAKKMAKEGKNNNEIFAKTGWFRDKVTGKMKFNFSDKYMDIIPKKYEIGKEYTLKEILKHDTLFEMYPQLEEYKVIIMDLNVNKEKKTIKGSYNRYDDIIRLDHRIFNEKIDVEGTLIHEIQHAIQKIENFSRGASKIWGEKFYKNSPGEIEARDTRNRLIEEKYDGKDLSDVMPESGKIAVSILDKMKIGLYNYISDKKRNKKGGIKNDEVISENEGKNTQYNSKNNNLVLGGINKNSINTQGAWQSFLDNQIGPTGKGKTVQELRLPTKETINNKKVDAYNVLYQDNNKINKLNLPIVDGGKVRKHYKSIMQSSNTSPEAKAIAKELIGSDTYVPDSNKRQLETADNRIMSNGADNEAVTLATKVKNNDKITADDIAVGERLIEYYSKTGEKEKLQDAIQNVALAGTQAGQTVQAMSLINRQTPQGQAVYLSKVVDRMNKEIEKKTKGKGQQFNLTPEMLDKITNSSKDNLEKNIDEVARELAKQVPKTTMEKIDSWRYFSMLANPRTHIRNIIGNLSMASVQTVKNKVAGGLEAIAQKTGMIDKRTKTLKPASKEVKSFAKEDVENVLARLNNESKFDTKNLIQQYQRTFKSNILENTLGKLYNLNSKALETEDILGLKSAYRKAMADYMTANKLTVEDLNAGTKAADTKLENARKYAIEQAQEATFHQYSSVASLLNTLENKNKATKLLTGAIIPFKKTPINVAKTGIEYSPVGIVKAFTTDIAKLRKGDINANQYIDNIAKGLTGTGITVAGYALAQAGILLASGDDDDQKNQYYQEDRGNQSFSLKIGDKTYSLDWLSPTAIPLFIGAQLNDNVNSSGEEQTTEDMLDKISNSIDALSSAMNPMIEMSMLSGVASAVKSFAQGDAQFFQNLAINSAKSYVNQFFPTLGGQIAKMVDDTERSTTSTKQNMFSKAVDSTSKQILNKIPFASKLLPAKTDVWGNKVKREPNKLYRALQQAVFPWTEKELKSTNVDNSISDLYERTGDNSVLPNTSINKDFTINFEKYRLTSEEYANYKKQYGKTSYNLLNKLTNSSEYKNMTDEQKTKAISEIYSYANEKNKIDYANKNKIKDVKESTTYKTIEQIKQDGGNESDYFKYIGSTLGVDKQDEKIDVLSKMSISGKSKSAIYKSTFGKDDDVYNKVLSKNGIDINEYLKYKTQKFTSDKKDDGTIKGKTIPNSEKNKVFNYVNNMKLSYENRLVLLGQQYKLGTQEREELFHYINNTNISADDKLKIYEKMKGFTVYKNGNVEY
nr:MAG TPA: Large polyvalent protein associated domain 23 [Caudoviricetes sp.]